MMDLNNSTRTRLQYTRRYWPFRYLPEVNSGGYHSTIMMIVLPVIAGESTEINAN